VKMQTDHPIALSGERSDKKKWVEPVAALLGSGQTHHSTPSDHTFMPAQSGAFLSQGVSIKGSVKFLNELFIDGKVKGTIDSTGTLTIGEHARIRGNIRTKSVNVRGTVEGNIFATERCELQAGCTLRGDIEATWLVVNENATFLGNAKVGTWKSLSA
jgi:cytoskeletal protein CcmA (bactofilin family)